jgi:hypothetical protein
MLPSLTTAQAEDAAIRKAATLYASFDHDVIADFALGEKTLSTRFNHETEKGKFVFEKGFDPKVFHIAQKKGISGGALEPLDALPRNGRIFFPAKSNLAFNKAGWSGAVSVWINTDPNTVIKSRFCDPVQITQKGANNGGIWFDFNDAKPRDMRMGVFPAVPEGKTGIKEEDPDAPMVRVKAVPFKSGEWHHMVLNWSNFDTGKKDAIAAFYVDGKLMGEVKDRDIAMDWDIEKAGIYIAVGYLGLLDEFAVFGRALTTDEIKLLHEKPALLNPLKNKAKE